MTREIFVPIAVALITGGLLREALIVIFSVLRNGLGLPSKAVRTAAGVDASILTVARARDELEADNQALRETLAHERKDRGAEREMHMRERAAWAHERAGYQAEIDRLLERVRKERAEAAARYDELLAELHSLRARHSEGGGR